jgi:hypothetical protein
MDLYRILKQAYNFGRDNGSGKSEKNLNDFIEIPKIKQLLIPVVVGQSEQLPENYCTLNIQTCGKGSGCKYPHCHI